MTGLFDLPAPLWHALDAAIAWTGTPAGLRVAAYGALSGWLCMALYRRLSRQSELGALGAQAAALRRELATYDGEFDGLWQRVTALARISTRHLRLSFVPALASGLPLLFVLPWLSNQFGHVLPTPGTPIELRAEQRADADPDAVASLRWSDPRWQFDAERGISIVPWPTAESPVMLHAGDAPLLTLPLPAASPVVHPFVPVFNHLFANPGGYLPDDATIAALHLALPTIAMHPFGPSWLRHWLTTYIASLVIVSLLLRWRWGLH